MFSLEGKTAVVTGGSQGLGRGFALALARQGADVVVAFLTRADEDADQAAETQRLVRATGRDAVLVEVDLTRSEDVERLRRDAGRVDILVNNVGGFPTRPL